MDTLCATCGQPLDHANKDMTPNCTWCTHLYALQRAGTINMFAAPKYLQDTFGLSKQEATDIFLRWTEGYKQEYYR